jgi:uncharacterized protein (TIGR02284 family)
VAEASGSRTHLRHKVPHTGFEDQAQHRPRLASSVILASAAGYACDGDGRHLGTMSISSNSNPSPLDSPDYNWVMDPYTRADVQSLNKLIEVCLDGELGYRTAAEHIHNTKLHIILNDYAIRRSQLAEELRAEVQRLGGNPGTSGTMAASLHRGWMALLSAASGGSAKAILAACETGEDSARASYEAAANSDLPAETKALVQKQSHTIQQARERMHHIHDELVSGLEFSETNDVI